jgi:hypothetical protein
MIGINLEKLVITSPESVQGAVIASNKILFWRFL